MPKKKTTSLTLYHYAGCGTCKKAIAWLAAHEVEVARIDLVATPPDAATLKRLWQRSDKPLAKFFNTSGQSYRNGGFRDRLPDMSDAQQLAALAADGKLIKRPLLDLGDRVLVGFKPDEWEAQLAAS